ncbi:EAL domain-containing protein [Sinorhizobium terangae]|uniref:EAL domain-containing protein n=1 Tax=Sinorhizobium terangae TaxID=110322 RepID=A0A6N7LBF2_SINTE|nr:EAL domain-containing protein [Sinorhizobium terangae]MBB4187776.1 EAL domain-containing protein (putative c-di-GMP-specific phosphodiesterase class I) [Sinorhizobium terangae]MQX14235.1 EAL domain-containing protein [Sinorhizobium terangae]WFU51358.1 EAL domain-containing protein [Sinorhizobium terangae]
MNLEKFSSVVRHVTHAMQHGRIGFSLQQINSIDDPGKVLYSECLGRLIEPDGTIRTSSEFIAFLEASGRAPAFDRHVIELASDWLARHPSDALGCNISAENIADKQSWALLYDLLHRHRAIAPRLVVEITESLPIAPLSAAADLLQSVRELGYKVAIDDFGTGCSTPETLLALRVDIVKIDGFFVQHRGDTAERFLRCMVGLASCAASTVVVEGIETYAQLEAAKAAGATHVQGFLLSEPTLPPVHYGWVNSAPHAVAAKWMM